VSSKVSLSVIMACLVMACSVSIGDEGVRNSDDLNYWEVTFGYASWSDLGTVEPAPVDFVAEESGRFEDQAFGIEIAFHRLQGEHGNALFLFGGELAGYGFDNERSLVGYDVVTGEPATIRMEASWGHVTASVRWIFRAGRRVELLVGGGAGTYLLRFTETVDDFGVVDRGESDATLGGYLAAGARLPFRSGKMAIRVDLRVHAFGFSRIGGAFEGQEISGPVTLLNFGMDF
jgi:hypothetical protein